jgi:PAS domain-containing protein
MWPSRRTSPRSSASPKSCKRHRHHLEELVAQRTADLQAAKKRADDISHYARSLFEASLDPLLTISAQGLITDANLATERATGLSRAIWWAPFCPACSPSPNARAKACDWPSCRAR